MGTAIDEEKQFFIVPCPIYYSCVDWCSHYLAGKFLYVQHRLLSCESVLCFLKTVLFGKNKMAVNCLHKGYCKFSLMQYHVNARDLLSYYNL